VPSQITSFSSSVVTPPLARKLKPMRLASSHVTGRTVSKKSNVSPTVFGTGCPSWNNTEPVLPEPRISMLSSVVPRLFVQRRTHCDPSWFTTRSNIAANCAATGLPPASRAPGTELVELVAISE
jgi:hypothetical protein